MGGSLGPRRCCQQCSRGLGKIQQQTADMGSHSPRYSSISRSAAGGPQVLDGNMAVTMGMVAVVESDAAV